MWGLAAAAPDFCGLVEGGRAAADDAAVALGEADGGADGEADGGPAAGVAVAAGAGGAAAGGAATGGDEACAGDCGAAAGLAAAGEAPACPALDGCALDTGPLAAAGCWLMAGAAWLGADEVGDRGADAGAAGDAESGRNGNWR